MAVFFNGQTSNATSSVTQWTGGTGTFYAQGTFDGATVQVQVSFDNGVTWLNISDASLTSAGAFNLEIGAVLIRAVLTDAGGNTNITAGF